MQKECQVAAFEGGALRVLLEGLKGREAVLALPLSRLVVKMLRVKAEEDLQALAEAQLKAISPFPDEPLTVSCEKVRETEKETIAIAAALPESAADDIAEALDAAKLNIVKIDVLAIGALRGLWPQLGIGDEDAAAKQRRLVLLDSPDCLSLIVLDGAEPSAMRAITNRADIKREIMLSLLEAEDFGGSLPLAQIFWVAQDGVGSLEDEKVGGELADFGVAIKRLTIGSDASLVGVAERAADATTLDMLPASWRDVLNETRFKAKLARNLIIAGVLWALVMGVLFGVPVAYGYMTAHTTDLCKRHSERYKAVADTKKKVEVVRKYSDHALGSLEIMKAVSDRLPGGVTLTSWDFERGVGVHVKGEAATSQAVYDLKDAMADMRPVGEDGEDDPEAKPIFPVVKLGPLSASKGGVQKFDLECAFEVVEE